MSNLIAQRLALLALGRAWILLGSRENSKPEKCSKSRTVPTYPAVRPARAAVRSMALLGRGSLPGLGLNTSKHIREQEENDGACCPPTEDADNDGLRRRDRKPDQSRET